MSLTFWVKLSEKILEIQTTTFLQVLIHIHVLKKKVVEYNNKKKALLKKSVTKFAIINKH